MSAFKIDREAATGIVETIDQLRWEDPSGVRLLTLTALRAELNKNEARLVDELIELDPASVGIYTDVHNTVTEPDKDDFDLIPETEHTIGDTRRIVQAQYVPKAANTAFMAIQAEMEPLGLSLSIGSSYRSPAYQAGIVLTQYVKKYNYNFRKTLELVTLPMNSEHGDIVQPAIDYLATRIPKNHHSYKHFGKTPEYAWMDQNGARFGLRQSFKKGNTTGIKPEEWHWRLVGVDGSDS